MPRSACIGEGRDTIAESRRDQEEGGELDSQEARLSFAGPGEIKRREVSWTLRKKLDFYLRVPARSRRGRWCWTLKLAQKRSRAGRWSWAQKVGLILLQLFLNSCATDIVLVTLLRTAVQTVITY